MKTNIHSLNHEQRKALNVSLYKKPGYFQKTFSADRIEFNCQPHATTLRNEIERILLEKKIISHSLPLERLHEVLPDEMIAYDFDYGVNKISTFFYDTDSRFMEVYHQFVKFIRQSMVTEHFWFQEVPTIRIHCPNALNAGLYPRYHTDICYGHPPEEINLWLPLTNPEPDHGFRVMSLENSKKVLEQYNYDYSKFIESTTYDREFSNGCDSLAEPILTKFGDVVLFDSRCVHSGEPLKLHTRISIDIRVLPIKLYEKMDIEYQGSGRRKVLFAPGHCYHKESSHQFLTR